MKPRATILATSRKSGLGALFFVVMLGTSLLVLVLTAADSGITELNHAVALKQIQMNDALGNACLNYGLGELRRSVSYSGGTVNLLTGSCIITVTFAPTPRMRVVSETPGETISRYEADLVLTGTDAPTITLSRLRNFSP